MLSSSEFDALMDKHGLDTRSRAVVQAIRDAEPSRRVASGSHNVSCRYPSKKMRKVIQAESHTCELPAVVLWEHDDCIYEFYDQCPPIGLKYKDQNGRNRGHSMTPDFFVIGEDYIGWVECKAQSWLEAKALKSSVYTCPEKVWRCIPGEEFAVQYKLGFRVLVDTSINQIFVRNLNFLSDFLDTKCPAVEESMEKRVIEAFDGKRSVLLADLLKVSNGELADSVYKLIADQKLYTNLQCELLVDIQFTHVYQDPHTAELSRLIRAEQVAERSEALIPSIVMEAGRSLLWDRQPWEIMNVGANQIAIKGATGVIQTLNRGQLLSLVKAGHIQGSSVDASTIEDEVGKRINTASDADLNAAQDRLKKLEQAQAGRLSDVPERTLRYWKAKVRDSKDALGNGFVGLISRIKDRGNRNRKISEAVLERIRQVIEEHLLGHSPKTIGACFSILCAVCHREGLTPPSRKTFGEEVKRTTSKHDQVLARSGAKSAYAHSEIVHWHLDNAVPAHGDRAFEIAHVDHTQMDVQLIHSVYGTPMGKPWLTILMDAFTRMVLAYVITYEKPSYRSCMLVMRECLRRHNRVPATIICDKGSEFASIYWEVLLAKLQVTKKTRPTAKGRFGSVIERFFGIANTQLFHQLKGNNTPLQAPRSMSGSHDPRKSAVWTLAEITAEFDDYLENTYSRLTHSALGVSPKFAEETSLRNSGIRNVRILTPSPMLTLLCLPELKGGEKRIVPGRGILVSGEFYFHPKFKDPSIANTKARVRYDPFDYAQIYAKVGREWLPCICPGASQLVGRTEREVRILTYELRALTNNPAAKMENNILLGERLLTADGKEKVLSQRKGDLEKQAADARMGRGGLGQPEDAGEKVLEVDATFDVDDADIENYGEFE